MCSTYVHIDETWAGQGVIETDEANARLSCSSPACSARVTHLVMDAESPSPDFRHSCEAHRNSFFTAAVVWPRRTRFFGRKVWEYLRISPPLKEGSVSPCIPVQKWNLEPNMQQIPRSHLDD